jgi:hypothetical protein
VDYRTSVERALAQLEPGRLESIWNDALGAAASDERSVTVIVHEGMILEHHKRIVPASVEAVYKTFTSLGGERGWFNVDWAWRLRGFLDRMFGGVGFRRGRRDPDELQVGDALDFWRVETLEPERLLRLRAEMKLPGKAWLQWRVTPWEKGKALLVQTSFFAPKGLTGWLYWYVSYPLHRLIFRELIDQIANRAVSPKPKQD